MTDFSNRGSHPIVTTPYLGLRPRFTVFPLLSFGRIDFSSRLMTFDEWIITRIDEPLRERTQLVQSNDANKIYAMGIEHMFFSFSGSLLDTNIDAPQQLTQEYSAWDGKSYKRWITFYEDFAKLSSCAKNNTVVIAQYTDTTLYGSFTQCAASMNAGAPHEINLVATFLVNKLEVNT